MPKKADLAQDFSLGEQSAKAAFQLECLKLKHNINHFALRNRIYAKALRQAMCELSLLKSA